MPTTLCSFDGGSGGGEGGGDRERRCPLLLLPPPAVPPPSLPPLPWSLHLCRRCRCCSSRPLCVFCSRPALLSFYTRSFLVSLGARCDCAAPTVVATCVVKEWTFSKKLRVCPSPDAEMKLGLLNSRDDENRMLVAELCSLCRINWAQLRPVT